MVTQINPFNISFGKPPLHPVARHDEFQTIIETFDNVNPETNSFLLTGPRGCGKTAMLTEIKNYYDAKKDWLAIDLIPDGDMLQSLAAQLYDVGKMKKLFLKAEFPFSFQGIGITLGKGETISDTLTFLSKQLEYLKKKQIKLLITIDEAVSNVLTRPFMLAFQRFLRQSYDVYLVMAGLPRNIVYLQNQKTLTFLHRSPKVNLATLYMPSIARCYQEIFKATEGKAVELAKFTKGYAFGFQLLGSVLFKRGKLDINQDVLDEFDQIMFARSYSVIWKELSPKQKALLRLMESNGTIANDAIIASGLMTKNEISVYQNRLINEGVLERVDRGVIGFALPRFEAFISQVNKFS